MRLLIKLFRPKSKDIPNIVTFSLIRGRVCYNCSWLPVPIALVPSRSCVRSLYVGSIFLVPGVADRVPEVDVLDDMLQLHIHVMWCSRYGPSEVVSTSHSVT